MDCQSIENNNDRRLCDREEKGRYETHLVFIAYERFHTMFVM